MTPVSLTKLVILLFVLQLIFVGYVVGNNFVKDRDQATNLRQGCERSKKDRLDNADFQMAQSEYIGKVTGAKSVKEDVKTAARTAQITFTRTSAGLTERSKINCTKLFPEVRFP